MVIVNGDISDKYGNNVACISFSIQDIFIDSIIELSDWSIIATCFLIG